MARKIAAGVGITVWMALGISVIFCNASVLRQYRHPIALVCWHMIVSCVLVGVVQVIRPQLLDTSNEEAGVPALDLKQSFLLGMPVAVVNAMGLVLSNTAYLFLSVGFIQMIKAFTACAVYMVGCILGTQTWSWPVAKTLFLTTFGLVLASAGEVNFNLTGMLCQAVALAAEGFRINLLEIRLKSKGYKLNPLSSMKILAPLVLMTLLVCLLALDRQAFDLGAIARLGWGLTIVNGLLACVLNLSVFFVIQVAGGLALALSGIAKDILIVGAAAVFRGDTITPLQVLGYSLAVIGVQAYVSVKKDTERYAEEGVACGIARDLVALLRPDSQGSARELPSVVGAAAAINSSEEELFREPELDLAESHNDESPRR